MSATHDVVVVGAGSAGCTLVGRLSADPACRVLLLEAGGPDRRREIRIPAAFSKLFKSEVDWNYSTEPQPELADRRLYWPRGKVLGGSSSINAMIYIRGHRAIYDQWRGMGCEGWGYVELLPYFKRSEAFHDGESAGHGGGGPLHVSEPRDPNVLSSRFVDAAVEAGLPRNEDFNVGEQEGVGLYHLTQKRGRRWSAADAFLKPALSRSNLTVETDALALRVLFEGRRAVGVEYEQQGEVKRAMAAEVVLAGGAVSSPQLLMLSGIGDAAELERLQIPVVADRPGVGSNLQDHLVVVVGYECLHPVTLASAESLGNLARFLLLGRGPLSSNVAEAGGFARLDSASEMPELQFHFTPSWFVRHGFDNPAGHGMSLGPTLVRPQSRGRMTLRSADPSEPPRLDPRYLTDRFDLDTLVKGVRLARHILGSPALAAFRGAERFPGAEVEETSLLEHFVRRYAESLYHPVGTCKMGLSSMSVVDPELRVHALDGLRVADASIMPLIPNGNTNAPSIMIGEKAADLVAGSG